MSICKDCVYFEACASFWFSDYDCDTNSIEESKEKHANNEACDIFKPIADVAENVIVLKVKPGNTLYRVGEDYDSVHEEIVYKCELFKARVKIHTKYYRFYDNEIDNNGRFYSTKEKAEEKIAEEKQKYQSALTWIMNGTTKICPYCEAKYRLKTRVDYGHGGGYFEYQAYDVHRKCVKCNRYVREENK